MRYLKTYKIFESDDSAFNNPFGYVDMKHFEEFFTESELKNMIRTLEDILIEVTDMGCTYKYGVDDIDDEFYIMINKGKNIPSLDLFYLQDIIFRIKDFMKDDWYVKISINFFNEMGSLNHAIVTDKDGELYINIISGINRLPEMPFSSINSAHQINFKFILQKGKI